MRWSRSRWSVCTVDSEERAPTAGVAGSCLSGTAGRLAAPLRLEDGCIWRVHSHAAA